MQNKAAMNIDTDIPIPAGKCGGNHKWPWDQLEVGDSFLMPRKLSSASGQATAHAKKTGRKYTCRTEAEGIRIWRVA